MIKCRVCGTEKNFEEFTVEKRNKSGITAACKDCTQERYRKHRAENKDRINEERRKAYVISGENEKRRLRHAKVRRESPVLARSRRMINKARARSTQHGIPFDVCFTADRIRARLHDEGTCECCGRLLDMSFSRRHDATPTLDRVDNDLGYVAGNVAILCYRCNCIKGNAHVSELITIVEFLEGWKQDE